MKIMKASAGSGKTFRLANSYIDLLLESDDRYAYRHILAVTFTNKATAEMKSRILKSLAKRAETEPKARQVLSDILHDYSAFSISTIDKFFQQALKAFAREIGLLSSYQIDLDRESLIQEAMDRILDSLTEDSKELLSWIQQSLDDSLSRGERYNFDKALYETGEQLGSEQHRQLAKEYGINDIEAFSKERLKEIRKKCRSIISDFEKRAADEGLPKPESGKIKIPGKKIMAANPALEDLFEKPYTIYNTAVKLDSFLLSLGLAREFYKEFDALLKEKNVMCLDESNTLLGRIIDGSDAPFVYEKLGVRFEHFLLDEFQDTSTVQWENFLPLLAEAESHKGKSLVVGDVKQSIYRWRGSDWRLLDKVIPQQFPKAETEVLENNWRSCRSIVEFNNRFFEWVATRIGYKDIYADVRQGIMTKDTEQTGEVKLSFRDDIQEAVLESITQALDKQGAGYGDIAVLVRGNADGSSLAAYLISKGIPVLSDDSLKLKSALTVRRAISLLSFAGNPNDETGSYLAKDLNITFPNVYHSIVDMAEAILRALKDHDPERFAGETLFIQTFMDDLQSWTQINGNDLGKYLSHWQDSNPSICSPAGNAAVRIITIHKSKGLQFPYVIFPYAEKVEFYKHDKKWCHLDGKGTELGIADGIYPVDLTEDCSSSLFSQAYEEEQGLQMIDNLNIFYVALTRAEKTLHIISKMPGKTILNSMDKEGAVFKRFSDLLYKFCGKNPEYREGCPYDFRKMPAEEKEEIEIKNFSYESFPLGSRLVSSSDAEDFFSDDGQTGASASRRIEGVALHRVLSSVNKVDDLNQAIKDSVMNGELSESEAENAKNLLERRINSHPEWFEDCDEVLNEQTIFASDGREGRPDRVIIRNGKVTVLDYKFGTPKESYRFQILRYIKLFHQLGYKNVDGAVWYVRDDQVEIV